MDKPRTCSRCAAPLVAAPLSFTVAFVCPTPTCTGRVYSRPQDVQRVVDELTVRCGSHLRPWADPVLRSRGAVPIVLELSADREISAISDLPIKRAA